MKDCIFCRITTGKIHADTVYEDDLVLAFLDIAPLNKGHALVVPKEHHVSVTTLPARYAGRMMEVAGRVGGAMMRAVECPGFNLLLSNGACAGQAIPHVHLHVVPRFPDDGIVMPARQVAYESPAEKQHILDKVKMRLTE